MKRKPGRKGVRKQRAGKRRPASGSHGVAAGGTLSFGADRATAATTGDEEIDALLRFVGHNGGLATRQLATRLEIDSEGFADLVDRLFSLEGDGFLIYAPRGGARGWEVVERSPFRIGRLQTDKRGAGYVRLLGGREEDLYIPPSRLKDAFPGDEVLVKLVASSHDARSYGDRLREARVVDLRQRGQKAFRGVYRRAKRGGIVEPDDPRAPSDVFVPQSKSSQGARDGETVLVRLRRSTGGSNAEGEIIAMLGDGKGYESDLATVVAEFELLTEHSAEIIAEAAKLPAITDGADWPDRRDCRELLTFTIDPKDARDFDDAISLEDLPGGEIRLGVHIADVSHYVRPGTELDAAAEQRGTSVYLPGKVLPMLPERLSNDLCSLRPNEDRLAKSVFLIFGTDGELRGVEIDRTVIHSRRRFTYEEVLAILDDIDGVQRLGEPLPDDHDRYRGVLARLATLRNQLTAQRRGRGALFLDLPKLRLEIGESGEVEGIGRDERDPSHELIEEFMLAANEAVARCLVSEGLPLIGRAHSEPDSDKLEDFRELLVAVGFRLDGGAQAADFQRLVDDVVGSPVASAIQLALLRTMPHADYVPGASPHFALATEAYCHFTSPIRRYPDLIVHQVLDEWLSARARNKKLLARRLSFWQQRVEEVSPSASAAERRAESAERSMNHLGLIRFLEPRLGEQMDGWIVSVHPFGFVVRIEGLLIEGIVHVATLSSYFEFDRGKQVLREKRSGRGRRGRRYRSDDDGYDDQDRDDDGGVQYSLGKRVRVELSGLDPAAREIRFHLV